MRFAGHEAELDDGEASDGCKNEAGKAERPKVCLHCERHKKVGDGACNGEKRDELGKRNAVMQKAQRDESGEQVPGEVSFIPVERHGGDGAPPFAAHDFRGVGDACAVHLDDCA